jgi:exosome complex exonuclease DIS3/RRP44
MAPDANTWSKDAHILNTKYCKTIIKSRRAFTYNEAQELMDSADQGNLAKSIRNLNMIAKKLKQKRI